MTDRTWPFGQYPRGGVVRLGPHVTAYHGDAFPIANSAIVRGRDATLVFDANILRFARRLRELTAEDGPPITHLVLSHHHDDHTFGAMHFAPPARVLGRAYVRTRLERYAAMDRQELAGSYEDDVYDPDAPDEIRALRFVLPDEDVERETAIDLGGVRVRLFPLASPAHTRGDLWAHVEPDDVVLCGDLWFVDCEPYFGSGSVAGAVAAVAELRTCRARAYLPGHGPVGVIGDDDPVERFGRWLLEATALGLECGLEGAALGDEVRGRFEEQRGRSGGVGFALQIPGFLEDGVEAAARDPGAGS